MSVISTPFNNRVPSALRVAYPWMTNQSFTDFWADKFVPASTQAVNYVAARIVAGHTPTIEQVAALEEFIRGSVAAGDDTISKRLFIFGDTLAASALDLWSAAAKLTWVGPPSVASGYVQGNGSTQYGILNDVGTAVWATNSAHHGFFALGNLSINQYYAGASSGSTAAMEIFCGGGPDAIAGRGLNNARTIFNYISGGSKCGVVCHNDFNQVGRLGGVFDDAIDTSLDGGNPSAAGAGSPPTVAPTIMATNLSGSITIGGTSPPFRCWFMGHGFPSNARMDAFMFRLQKLLTLWYPFPS